MSRRALAAVLALPLLLAGCTAPRAVDALPAPVRGTVRVPAKSLVSVAHPVPHTTVPVDRGLAPEPDRPGGAFRVLPHRTADRRLLIAWVDSGIPACGEVSRIWAHETTMQIVVTVYEPPRLAGTEDADCPAQGVVHIQAIPLTTSIADRTTNAFSGVPAFGAF